ncbi:hypothetical protein [Anabaena catenula]|uniref:hypothetical protein n=1 Tax=Anabaena catenula TaxID=1296320 RepID=UPI0016828B4A|nr:hypothetical protein [Anabaena catenula]
MALAFELLADLHAGVLSFMQLFGKIKNKKFADLIKVSLGKHCGFTERKLDYYFVLQGIAHQR